MVRIASFQIGYQLDLLKIPKGSEGPNFRVNIVQKKLHPAHSQRVLNSPYVFKFLSMSTEEAHTLVKALHKADADNSHSNVRDVLQALHDFPGMNELILKETKLGKVVQGFKGKYDNENPDISKYVTSTEEEDEGLAFYY